ncbi:MAG: hypothetical protein LJE59_06955 [Chromatiaceae bacterium]|nr:hypothetical protein [Chromatiaceae bacterium]
MRWPERLLLVALLCCARVAIANDAYDELYRLYDYPQELNREQVPVCSQHGCERVTRVALSAAQWQQVGRHLAQPAASAAAEREQIREAIAEMERVAGLLAGTSGDRGGDLAGLTTLSAQMDCVDEASNTTTYLTLFEQAGLLHWHQVEPRVMRGYFIVGGWPHFTALLRERQSGDLWVVDSWFRDNGQPPDVVELATWKAGWKPEGFVF